MATTEVLLIEQVDNLGSEGDVVKVRSGFARNWLLPKRKAVPLEPKNKKRMDALMQARARREANERTQAEEIAAKLRGSHVAIAVKTGTGGKLFGSVTSGQLLEKYEEIGFHLDKRHLVPFRPVKELGKRTATFRLHEDVEVEVEYEIVSENPIETEEEKE
tara:strand:+ start:127 stop:609 length:483 start_codon:yes stop_codon:yes gene_type:complete